MSCMSFFSIFFLKRSHFEDQVELYNLKPGVYVFELKVTDSSDQTDTEQITVLVLTPEQSESEYTQLWNSSTQLEYSRTPELELVILWNSNLTCSFPIQSLAAPLPQGFVSPCLGDTRVT